MRILWFAGFILCAALMSAAMYMQIEMKLEPCPLCILQRIVVVAIGIVCFIAFVHNPLGAGRRVYGFFVVILGALGMALAGRHVWLQNLPADQVPECGPGLEFIVQNFPITEALNMVLRGSGECAEIQWMFLGLSISGWTFVIFAIITLVGFGTLFSRRQYRYY